MGKPKYHTILIMGAQNFYGNPLDILEESDWTWDQKEDLLLNWKYYVICEEVFENPQKTKKILEINQALNFLKARRNLH